MIADYPNHANKSHDVVVDYKYYYDVPSGQAAICACLSEINDTRKEIQYRLKRQEEELTKFSRIVQDEFR